MGERRMVVMLKGELAIPMRSRNRVDPKEEIISCANANRFVALLAKLSLDASS
jgi:hypothetical protein